MLIKYKKSYRKIAMGLLSLMPKERNLKTLLHTINKYDEDPRWQLYFWKEDNAYVGLVGVEVSEDAFTVKHLSVLPCRREEGIGQKMVMGIQELMKQRKMHASRETKAFLSQTSDKAIS